MVLVEDLKDMSLVLISVHKALHATPCWPFGFKKTIIVSFKHTITRLCPYYDSPDMPRSIACNLRSVPGPTSNRRVVSHAPSLAPFSA